MYTAEITTAVIVVSLPGLKSFVMRGGLLGSSKDPNSNPLASNEPAYGSRFKSGFTPRFQIQEGSRTDDEVELVYYREPSLTADKVVSETRRVDTSDDFVLDPRVKIESSLAPC